MCVLTVWQAKVEKSRRDKLRKVEKRSTPVYPEAFGVLLRKLRNAQGWTQRRMGIEADKSPTLISHWENGKVCDKRFRLS